jgi:hypothetical protein
VSAALTLVLAACSDSTAPKPLTSQQLAQDIDQVFAAHLAAGTSRDSLVAGDIAEFIELGPAFGGTESSVTVTTGSGAQKWHGVGFALDGNPGDTTFVGAFYPDRSLTTVLILILGTSNGTLTESQAAISTTGLTSGADTTLSSGAATVASKGGTCSLQSGLAADPFLSDFAPSATCTPAKIQMSFAVTFRSTANLGALTSVSVSGVTINGPIFSAAGPSRVVGIPSKSAAMVAQLRALLARRH